MADVAVMEKSSLEAATYLSIAPPIDVNRRRSHDSHSLHLPGVRAVLEDPVTVPDRQTEFRIMMHLLEMYGIFANFITASYISDCGMMGGNVWRRSLTWTPPPPPWLSEHTLRTLSWSESTSCMLSRAGRGRLILGREPSCAREMKGALSHSCLTKLTN